MTNTTKRPAALHFERKVSPTGVDCRVAFGRRTTPTYYGTRTIQGAVRAIREEGGWRIDRCDWLGACFAPWEPADAGHTYPTLRAALRALRAWARAAGFRGDPPG